jgi:hypothetical protein
VRIGGSSGGGRAVVVVGGGVVGGGDVVVGGEVVGGGDVVVAGAVVVAGGGVVTTDGGVVDPTLDAEETPRRLSAFEPRVVVTVGSDTPEAFGVEVRAATGAGFACSARLGVVEFGAGPDVVEGAGPGRWGSEVATPRSVCVGGVDTGWAA